MIAKSKKKIIKGHEGVLPYTWFNICCIEICKDQKLWNCALCCFGFLPFAKLPTTELIDTVAEIREILDITLNSYFLNNLFEENIFDNGLNEEDVDNEFEFLNQDDKYYGCGDFVQKDAGNDHQICISDETFSLLGINIRSLNTSHCAQLEGLLDSLSFNPSVISINETYLKDNENGPHSHVRNYSFKSNCRKKFNGC